MHPLLMATRTPGGPPGMCDRNPVNHGIKRLPYVPFNLDFLAGFSKTINSISDDFEVPSHCCLWDARTRSGGLTSEIYGEKL